MTSLSELYQQELRLLKESAKVFSDEYPTLTANLVRESADPDIDMILKGVAYLTAQLRKEISDEFPIALQALSQVLTPTLMQPLPATTILDFMPKANLITPFKLAAGTAFDSVSLASDSLGQPVHCRFCTVWDVTVLPIAIRSVGVNSTEETLAGNQTKLLQLKMDFDASRNDVANYEFESLRLYFDMPIAESAAWVSLLKNSLVSLNVTDASGTRNIFSPKVRLTGYFLGENEPQGPSSPSTHQLLQDYYVSTEKYLFFDIDLSGWTERSGEAFTLEFKLSQPNWSVPELTESAVHLFATPAVNRFSAYAETKKISGPEADITLEAYERSLSGDHGLEIIDVEEVESIQKGRPENLRYQNLLSPDSVSTNIAGYNFFRKPGAQDGQTVPWLGLYNGQSVDLREEVLRIRVACCNGELASQIAPGDIKRPTSGSPELVSFTNLTAATQFQSASVVTQSAWQVVSDQALSMSSIDDAAKLKRLLMHHIPAGLVKSARQKSNIHAISAIEIFKVVSTEKISRGRPLLGSEYRVVMNGESFASAGELFMFSALLDQLFALQNVVNSFSQLVVIDSRTGEEAEWPVRLGTTEIL